MFVGESLVSFFFRVLNFAVLTGFGVFLFKRYGLPSIHQEVKEQEGHIAGLKHHRDTLKETVRTLERQSYEQAILCNQLAIKIGNWHNAVLAQRYKEQEEKQRLITLLSKKVHQQEQILAIQNLRKQVFPAAITQTRKELEQQFKSGHIAERYIEDLLRFMETGKL